MKIYKFGYWSFGGSPYVLLTNEKEFTKEQFDDIVIDATKQHIKFEMGENVFAENVDFGMIYDDVLLILINSLGFTKIESDISFYPYGDDSILSKIDNDDTDLQTLHNGLLDKRIYQNGK